MPATSQQPSKHPLSPARRLASLAVLAAGAVAAVYCMVHFLARWQSNAPSRLEGSDVLVTERAQEALRRVGGEDLSTLRERRAVALDAYRTVLADSPLAPYVWVEAGERLFELGRTEEGLSFLDVARRLDPLNPLLRYRLGNAIFFQLGPLAAVEDYRASLTLDPRRARAAYLSYWSIGLDPVVLLRALLPENHAAWSGYFSDALQRLPPEKIDSLWQSLRERFAYEEDLDLYRQFLLTVFEAVRRAHGEDGVAARARAIVRRFEVLSDIYGLSEEPRRENWLVPEGQPLAGGMFNPDFQLPFLQAGVGDWEFPRRDGIKSVGVVSPLENIWATAPERENRQSGEDSNVAAYDGAWMRVEFESLTGRPIDRPAQVMLLDGPSSYALTFEVASQRLFTGLPFRLGVTCWERNVSGEIAPRRYASPSFSGHRRPQEVRLEFYVLNEGDGPQTLRLVRPAGGTQDPPLDGALYLRFLKMESAPLPEGFGPKSVEADVFRRAIDLPAPNILEDLGLLPSRDEEADGGTGVEE